MVPGDNKVALVVMVGVVLLDLLVLVEWLSVVDVVLRKMVVVEPLVILRLVVQDLVVVPVVLVLQVVQLVRPSLVVDSP